MDVDLLPTMGTGTPPPPPPPPARRHGHWHTRITTNLGMLVALAGSVLLLISTYLPHFSGFEFVRYSLWVSLKAAEMATTDSRVAVIAATAANAMYFVFTVRRSPRHRVSTMRMWPFIAAATNVVVVIHLFQLSGRLGDPFAAYPRGSGFYVMILAGLLMVLGSIVGIFGRRPSLQTQTTGKATSAPPPPPPPPEDPPAAADRLRQLKSLLDDGLITQDEYDARRSRILDDI